MQQRKPLAGQKIAGRFDAGEADLLAWPLGTRRWLLTASNVLAKSSITALNGRIAKLTVFIFACLL
jgi:hypothetical protein